MSMKRLRGVTLALTLVAMLVVAGCAPQPAAQPTTAPPAPAVTVVEKVVEKTVVVTPTAAPKPSRTYKIGFANLVRDITFTIDVENGIKAAAEKAGNIELIILDNKLDGATALANADIFINQGVDGVIEFQTDEKFGLVIMDKFRAKNIPVIAIDIPMPGATFFGADNYRAGFMAGEALAKAFKERFPNAPPLLLLGELPQSGPIPAARIEGYFQGVKSVFPELSEQHVRRFDTKNTLEESRTQVANILTTIPPGTKFMGGAINDGSTLGMLAAIEAAGRLQDAVLAGQGADQTGREEMCRQGSIMIGSTAYFPEKYGEKIIPAMLKLLNGEPVPPAIYVDHVFITPKNIKQYYPDFPCPAAGG